MDRIVLPEIPLEAHVGVSAEERRTAQPLLIDVVIHVDLKRAGVTDDLADTVDYDAVCAAVADVVAAHPYHLIEAVAEEIAGRVLDAFEVAAIDVRVRKPGALRERGVPHAAVEIHRPNDG